MTTNIIKKSDFVSITNLMRKTKETLKRVEKEGQLVVLSNNEPKAVLLSLDELARIAHWGLPVVGELIEPTKEDQIAYHQSILDELRGEDEGVDAFDFLAKLK